MTGKPVSPLPNLAETREFLEGLPTAPAEHLAVIMEGKAPRVRTLHHGEVAAGIAWLSNLQGTHNCYYHANPLRDGVKDRKARREDVSAARMLHVDIDDLTALEKISSFTVAPSVVIMSGGGYQCLWFLRKPVHDLPRVEALNAQIAGHLGGDSCHSADHLLRLPGTLNVPNAKKRAAGRTTALASIVRPLTDFSRSYDLDDFAKALGEKAQLASPKTTFGSSEDHPLFNAETLPVQASDYTLGLLRHGDNGENPIGSPHAAYRSRSEVVFRVCCDIAKAGGDEATIQGVLLNPENGISASVLEQPRPQEYAARQARRAVRAVGDGWPNVNKGGQPQPTFNNALVALQRLGLTFEFDAFKNRKRVSGHLLQEFVGELSDDVCAAIREEVFAQWGFDPGKEHVRDAAHTLCLGNTFHPVRDYLNGLEWDGVGRAGRWLSLYFGAEDSPLHSEVGELVLVAAVRRIRQPGTKFDAILVLEGRQGSGKSTAINILASEEFFSDQDILTLDTKAQMEALEGVWLFELGELQGLNRAETDRVKAFASRRSDRARPAYGRYREDRPRQTIFIGTTNDEQYLRDATGNRRFWPVKTVLIDLEALRRDRDQLWAEASLLEASGRSLTLAEDLWGTAATAQESRLMEDPWLEGLRSARGHVEDGIERITTAEALKHLEMAFDRQNPSSAKRLVSLMRKLGWDGPKQMRIKGTVLRGYERPWDPASVEAY